MSLLDVINISTFNLNILISNPFSSNDPKELAYYNKIRKEMANMKKDSVKKGIPLNWDTLEGLDK